MQNITDDKPTLLNADITEDDTKRCVFIMQRAMAIAKSAGIPPEQIDGFLIYMDLCVLHCNGGRRLNLTAMCYAQPEDLMADLALIKVNLDRETGKLPEFVRLRFEGDSSIIAH